MFTAVMNLLLIILAIAVLTIWIVAVANSDGKCHFEDCDDCPFPCDSKTRKWLKNLGRTSEDE